MSPEIGGLAYDIAIGVVIVIAVLIGSMAGVRAAKRKRPVRAVVAVSAPLLVAAVTVWLAGALRNDLDRATLRYETPGRGPEAAPEWRGDPYQPPPDGFEILEDQRAPQYDLVPR